MPFLELQIKTQYISKEGSYEFNERNNKYRIINTRYSNENVIFDGTREINDLKDDSKRWCLGRIFNHYRHG